MSLDVGELVANLRVSTSKASADLAKGETQLTGQATKTGAKMGGGLSKGITSALKAGLGIAAGFIAFKSVTNFLHESIGAAEELNTSIARTEAVFGDGTKAVEKWAASTDKSLGLSKQAALDYASQLGNLFKQQGFTTTESAKLAEQTTTLSVAVAAFKKTDPSTVIAAMSAGYRGQYKSLAKLIPGISKAAVETEALRETGKTSASQLTAQEKATATLTLAQKNGADATKFYASTAGELGREQKVFNAELDNMKASIGQFALPLLTALAHLAANDVLPAIQEAGGAIVDLAHAINSLPAPVKTAGAGLLALVLLGPEIRELADTVGTNLSGAFETARIQALYMKDAFHEAGGGVSGLTKAIGAGAGAGLRGAASGLLSIVGGPWGLAFIGASAAVGVLISKHQQGKAQVESYTAAIKADSGALGENTRAAVVNALSKTNAFSQARALGISLSDLTDQVLGNTAATERNEAILDQYRFTAGQAHAPTQQLVSDATSLSATLGDQNNKLNKSVQGAKDFASAMGSQGAAAADATTSQDDLATSTDGVTTATKKATTAVATWIEKLDTATGHALGIQAANRGWQQSLDDARAALKSNGKTLNIHTQAGRDNRAAIDGMVTALQASADAQANNGTLTKTARDRLVDQKNTLIDVAAKFFHSRDAAKAYIDKLISIPPVVSTRVKVNTYDAVKALGVLQGQLNKLAAGGGGPNSKNSANGNIFYADGGENHVAQIAAGGSNRIWAEKETGGEGYIPLALSKRARSTAILADINNRFGNPLGGGGMSGPLVHVDNVQQISGTPDDVGMALRYHLRAAGL